MYPKTKGGGNTGVFIAGDLVGDSRGDIKNPGCEIGLVSS